MPADIFFFMAAAELGAITNGEFEAQNRRCKHRGATSQVYVGLCSWELSRRRGGGGEGEGVGRKDTTVERENCYLGEP